MLEKELRGRVKDVRKVLADPDNAMVIVTGVIPPGARKGDPLDLEVRLPPRSKATSLRGGHLEKCLLYNYDNTRHLSPNAQIDPSILIGHPLVAAEGSVLVGFGDGNEADRQRAGRVWGGGRCRRDFPLILTINEGHWSAALADVIARRVNANLQVSKGAPDLAIAVAVNHQLVNL